MNTPTLTPTSTTPDSTPPTPGLSRRHALAGLSVAAASLTGLLSSVANAQAPAAPGQPMHADHFQHCIKICLDCLADCEAGSRHCVGKLADGDKSYTDCAALCTDCPELCIACARLMSRRSPLTAITATACADCCDQCATACEKLPNDPVMVSLAKTCRTCAETCRAMAKMLGK